MNFKYIAVTALAVLPILAQASTDDPQANIRQHRQHERATQGVHTGELAHTDTENLRTYRRDVRKEERAYKTDDALSKKERRDLHQDLKQSNKDVYQEKHDVETHELE